MKQKIKALIIDVDGTLTDGKIYMGENGELAKAFCVKDGYAMRYIDHYTDIKPIILTGRNSRIVKNRCEEMELTECYQGVFNKLEKLKGIAEDKGISFQEIAYVGDDLNDYDCMKAIKDAGGVIGCPKDAVTQVKRIADFVSQKNGGDGAVREFIEWILEEDMLFHK